ncbi:MAG: polysaccharide deacetylase family protein [Cyclobacteriaceae bacterium]
MKKALGLMCLIVMAFTFSFCQKGPRLIVRGDDMGYSHSGNEAIIKCLKEGIQTSIEVIVPSPWFPEAVKMLAENPNVDVGIHLAITSEWDNVKWRPLTDCPSLKDEDGYFYPMISSNKNYPGKAIKDRPVKIEEVEKEFRAQIELALKKIPRISHISGHMGCTNLNEEVKAMTESLAKEYRIDIDPAALGLLSARYDGPHKTSEEKIESFISMLGKLERGKTYLFVDHPGLDSPELRAIHHIGYEDVAADRQGVTDLWTSERVKAAIKKNGIELISYADLKR